MLSLLPLFLIILHTFFILLLFIHLLSFFFLLLPIVLSLLISFFNLPNFSLTHPLIFFSLLVISLIIIPISFFLQDIISSFLSTLPKSFYLLIFTFSFYKQAKSSLLHPLNLLQAFINNHQTIPNFLLYLSVMNSYLHLSQNNLHNFHLLHHVFNFLVQIDN